MMLVRVAGLVVLILMVARPVAAQEPTAISFEDINPVEAAIDADHPDQCNHIGWALLFSEEVPETDTAIAHHASCHTDAGIVLFGGCFEPVLNDADNPPVDPTLFGKIHIFCTVTVFAAAEDAEILVDPADFVLINDDRREVTVDLVTLGKLPEGMRLDPVTLSFADVAGGWIVFVTEEALAEPFLLAWDTPTSGPLTLAAIVVDRLDTLPDE